MGKRLQFRDRFSASTLCASPHQETQPTLLMHSFLPIQHILQLVACLILLRASITKCRDSIALAALSNVTSHNPLGLDRTSHLGNRPHHPFTAIGFDGINHIGMPDGSCHQQGNCTFHDQARIFENIQLDSPTAGTAAHDSCRTLCTTRCERSELQRSNFLCEQHPRPEICHKGISSIQPG